MIQSPLLPSFVPRTETWSAAVGGRGGGMVASTLGGKNYMGLIESGNIAKIPARPAILEAGASLSSTIPSSSSCQSRFP